MGLLAASTAPGVHADAIQTKPRRAAASLSAYEHDLLRAVNATRADWGRGPLVVSPGLTAAAEVHTVGLKMEHMFTKAMHEGEPTADDRAIARVIGDVWLANLVAWVTRRASANDVIHHLELATRLLVRPDR